jgi:SAM-dependent methyltransferase
MTDYSEGWTRWGDMIRYSPAPFHRRRLILALAREVDFASVMDVGCGNATLLLALRRLRPGVALVGLDIADSVIAEDRAAYPDVEFHQLDIGAAHLSARCDLVVCSEVLEHVADWRQALRHLRRMCGAHLILTVPAGRVFPIDRLMGHERHFTLDLLSDGLRDAGFEPVRAWRWGFPFHTLYKRLINLSPEASVRRFSSGSYGVTERAVSTLLTWLFYLNSRRAGAQLVLRARVV